MQACGTLCAPPAGALRAGASCGSGRPHAHHPPSCVARPSAARPPLQRSALQRQRPRQLSPAVTAAAAGKDEGGVRLDGDRTTLQRHPSRLEAPGASNHIVPGPQLNAPGPDGEPAPSSPPRAAAAAAAEAAGAADVGSGGSSGAGAADSPASSLAGLHKPVGMVLGSAWLLAASVQLAGVAGLAPLWLPAVAGGVLGGAYTAAHHHIGERRLWRAPPGPLAVVITGGSGGIGKALAREFLRCGDRVLITSRSAEGAARAAEELRREVGPAAWVVGAACDVADPAAVEALAAGAPAALGGAVHVWVNNAGCSGSFKTLVSQAPEQVAQVVATNLTGSLLSSRAALRLMGAQPGGGALFLMEGAGSDGRATPNYASYGATKAAIAQLHATLQHEAAALAGLGRVGVHALSPGMVLTGLLLEGATRRNKQAFNILCEHPETVAAYLVPRARSAVARGGSGAAIRYLTPLRVLAKLLAAPAHAGRYFDRHGQPVYPPEHERILGQRARHTRRLQARMARRGGAFQLAYAVSMAACFALIAGDALARAAH